MSKYVLQRYVLRNIFPIIGKNFGKMIRILPKNVASLIFVGRNLLSLTFFISVKVDRETLLICSRRKQTMSLKNSNHINYNLLPILFINLYSLISLISLITQICTTQICKFCNNIFAFYL